MALYLFTLLHLLFAGLGRCRYDGTEITLDPTKHNEQFFSFQSRPDIEAPRWESKVYNQSVLAPGHWFVSPYAVIAPENNRHQYVAPAIYDSTNGELVWNGGREVDYYNVYTLKVVNSNGEDMLSFLQPLESRGVIMNSHYVPIRHVNTGNYGTGGNMHDFEIVNDGTRALFLKVDRQKAPREESLALGFDGECLVSFDGFAERDVNTGEVLFSWSSENHVRLSESYVYPAPDAFPEFNNIGWCTDGVGADYIHANSIDKLPDGDYLMSARHTYAVYKISHVDGSIVWRLGGKNSDFTLAEGLHFSGQHDARCISQNSTHMTITLMDNAVGVWWPDVGFSSNPNSRGLLLSLNLETMVATELAHYDHPDGVGNYAPGRGNVQILQNGNVLVTWSNNGLLSEYTPDGTLIAEAKFSTPLKTFRSFKFPWIGHSWRKPDVYATVVADGVNGELHTMVRVSWNGDTQAAQWSLYETDAFGNSSKLLNTTKRTGFETGLSCKGYFPFVKVDAVDAVGTFLSDSVSDAIQTVYLPEAGATSIDFSSLSDSAWNNLRDIPTHSVLVFLGGICSGALLLLGIRKIRWRNMPQRARRIGEYSALEDDDEKRGSSEDVGLLRTSDGSVRVSERLRPEDAQYSDSAVTRWRMV